MANTYLRPGAFINESLTALQTGSSAATATSVASFVGVGTRGPVIPTLISSWASFTTLFGTFANSPFLAYAVFTFFQNGGTVCYVTRVAHSDAVSATRTLNDGAGTPLPTLTITAANSGAWGNGITLDVSTGFVAGRFSLTINFGGTVVEQFNDLSLVATDARYAPIIINSTSLWVTATDLFSATAPPSNAPAAQTGVSLATGANGAAVTAADYSASVTLIGAVPQPIVLNLPGVIDVPTITGVQAIVAASSNMFLVIDTPPNLTATTAVSFAASLTPGSTSAVYFPWVTFTDPSRPNSGGATVTLPPGGAVVGQYVSTDLLSGPFQTPAGTQAAILGAIGLAATLQPIDYNTLNSAVTPVNAIKPIPGFGICIFGGRTLQGGFPSQYISVRRSLIYIEQSLLNLTAFAVFQPNDGTLWATIDSDVTDWLSAYLAIGGLRGATAADAFFVTCDDTNNTPASIQAGQVNVSVGVALQYPAEFVVINIGQFSGGTSTVTNSLSNGSDDGSDDSNTDN